jgi:HemK-related putative methylase
VIEFAVPSSIVRLVASGWLPFHRAMARRRVGRLVLEHLHGMTLVVLPDVFNPAVFRTTPLLLDAVAATARPGERVLDVGTGSGAVAIVAAMSGAHAHAVDVNAEAVRCARINAALNRVEGRVDVHHGDLFAPVAGQRFDLVVCNPPFFKGSPLDARDAAWRSEDFVERFAAGLDGVLAPDGRALVVFSDHGDERGLVDAVTGEGFAVEPERRRDYRTEIVTVYRVTRAGARG